MRFYTVYSRCWSVCFLVMAVSLLLPLTTAAQGTKEDYERANTLKQWASGKILNAKIEARWVPESSEFWYQKNLPEGKKEFILVDAEKGTREVVPEEKLPKNAK